MSERRTFMVSVPSDMDRSPVLWAARAVFAQAGWVEGEAGEAVVAAMAGCEDVVGAPGVYISPPLDSPGFVERMEPAAGRLLVVGASGMGGWAPAQAARLRGAEVLQLAHVDPRLEVAGDVMASIQVLARVTDRIRALVARL